MLASSILIFAATYLFILCLKRLMKRDPLKDIPGPKGEFWFGNTKQVDKRNPITTFVKWTKEYGNICKLNMAGRKLILVSGTEELNEVLVKNGKAFGGRRGQFRLDYVSEGRKDIFSMDHGPELSFLKKVASKHLKGYGSGLIRLEQITVETVGDILADLEKEQGPVNIKSKIQWATLSIMYIVIMGKKLSEGEEAEVLRKFTTDFIQVVSPSRKGALLDQIPWLRFFGNDIFKTMKAMNEARRKMFLKWKNQIQELEHEDEKSSNFIHVFMKKLEEDNPHGLTDLHADTTTWNLFTGGLFTTQSTLSSLINILIHHKDVQDKLYDENMKIVGNAAVRVENRSEMPYHQAAILETLRYTSIASLIAHLALEDTSIKQYNIPKGTSVLLNLWGHHHDEKTWGDPFTFRPERYLDAEGRLVLADHPARVSTLAFGAGTRVCVGESFAMARLFLILAMFVQKYEFLPATTLEEQTSCDCRSMKFGIAQEPLDYEVRLKLR